MKFALDSAPLAVEPRKAPSMGNVVHHVVIGAGPAGIVAAGKMDPTRLMDAYIANTEAIGRNARVAGA